MTIEREQVLKIAKLARLSLTEQETASLGTELNAILKYVNQLSTLDTANIPTTEHAIDSGDTLREDATGRSLPVAAVMANAPESGNGCFAVPKIIE